MATVGSCVSVGGRVLVQRVRREQGGEVEMTNMCVFRTCPWLFSVVLLAISSH